MSGLAGLALGTVPIAGGALLALAGGQLKGLFGAADGCQLSLLATIDLGFGSESHRRERCRKICTSCR